MNLITISTLTEILKSVIPCADYQSPRAFLERKIFNDKYNKVVKSGADNWEYLADSCVISELTRAILKRHLSSPRLTFAITRLIIYHYKGVLNLIEADIKRDLEAVSGDKQDCIVERLVRLQEEGALPLLKDYAITREDLPQAIVACAIHCFYFDSPNLRKVGNYYAKANINALNANRVSQEDFERDFPAYKFNLEWDDLVAIDCEDSNCDRCRHKCARLDSNYNVKQLLNLYLYFDQLRESYDTVDDILDDEQTLSFLDHLTDQLSYEAMTLFVKKLTHSDLSISEKIQYAIELVTQDRRKKKDEVKEN